MYRTKEYVERPWEEIKLEIDLAANAYPETQRIFLADGDALNVATDKLVQILVYLYSKFRHLKRISCYGMPKNISQKKDDELDKLRAVGLSMFYVGIETGNDALLKKVTKGATSKGIIQSCQRAKQHGYILSCMVILGLGGKTYTKEHIRDTARIISEIAPDYLGALTLVLEDGIYNEFMIKFAEPFTALDDIEVLEEVERFILDFNPASPVVFRANHASNVYSFAGTIPEDKEKLLSLIRELKVRPEMLKPKILRRF
jgi:radical SAM superfamily enzyme YgiQ (UPF0313 family)